MHRKTGSLTSENHSYQLLNLEGVRLFHSTTLFYGRISSNYARVTAHHDTFIHIPGERFDATRFLT